MKHVRRSRSCIEALESRIAPAVTLIPEAFGFTAGTTGHSAVLKIAGSVLSNVDQAEQLFAGTLAATFTGTDNGVGAINYADLDSTSGGNFGSNRDISVFGAIPSGDNDNYAIRASGFINITTPGTYTFGVNSDDGFRLKMGVADTVVAEATGVKGPSDVEGDVIFPTAGFYRYELTYFEGAGGSEVEFYVRGPGIPVNKLVGGSTGALLVVKDGTYSVSGPSLFVVGDVTGHDMEVTIANGGLLLDLSQAAQVFIGAGGSGISTAHAATVNLRDFATNASGGGFAGDSDFHTFPGIPAGDINDMAMRAHGFLYFPTPGTWKFGLNSDDGSSLTIGGSKVINADGLRGGGDIIRSVKIDQAGYYPYELLYFERGGGAHLEFFAQGPGDAATVLVGSTAASGLKSFASVHYTISGTNDADTISLLEFFPGMGAAYINNNYAGTFPSYSPVFLDALDGDDRISVDGNFGNLTIVGGNGNDTIVLSNLASLGFGGVIGGNGVDALDYSAWTNPIVANLGDRHAFATTLNGANENPAHVTAATGNALLFVTPGSNAMEIFSDVLGMAPASITGSHLHAATPGVNGPIFVDFGAGGSWSPLGTNGALLDVGGTLPGARIPDLLAGNVYFNVHSTAFPAGEIRGNFTLGREANSATGMKSVGTVENVIGGSAGDFMVGKSAATLRGGGGDDIIVGGIFDDLLDGGSGDDRLFPGLDAVGDIVRGGPGSDTLIERRIAGDATLTNTGYAAGFPAADNPLDGVDRVILSGDGGTNNFNAAGFTRGPAAFAGAEGVNNNSHYLGILSIADAIVATGGTGAGVLMSFTVSLAHALFAPVTFNLKTKDGTAKAPGDYTVTNGTVTIPAGATSAIITVPVEGNAANEPSEFFNVQISLPTGQPVKLGDALGRGIIYMPGLNIVNAKTATFRDADGDIVTVKTSAGAFNAGFFNMRAVGGLGGQILESLTLTDAFKGAKISFVAKRDPLVGGDGSTQVGFINAGGVDLASVTVDGDLAAIFAGDTDAATPALGLLQLGSFGVFGDFSHPAPMGNLSILIGALGKLSIRGDFVSVNLSTVGGSGAKIGSIFIGGGTGGGFGNASITSDGDIGSVFVKGTLRAVNITTKPGAKIGNITIGGDLIPGFSGSIASGATLGAVNIKGSVVGNSLGGVEIAAAGGGAPNVPAIKSVTVGGSASYLFIHAGLTTFGTALNDASAGIGAVKIGGDWIAGNILAGVRGIGGQFDTTPVSGIVSRIASITIGGTVAGAINFGTPPNAFAAGQVGLLKINKQLIPLSKLVADNIALSVIGDIRVIEFA